MNKQEALELLKKLIEDLNTLPSFEPNGENAEFKKWESRVERHLSRIFGEDSKQVKKLKGVKFHPLIVGYSSGFNDYDNTQDFIEAYRNDLGHSKTLLETLIEEVEEWEDEVIKEDIKSISLVANEFNKIKVFIVHGHDKLAITEVSEVLRKLKLEPIILHEQANQGNTIIEKIERHTNDVGFSIILYTECDIGGKSGEALRPRARQNVVLEHGYLMAKLGRENTMALKKGDVETPSDIDGVVYTSMDEHGYWKYKLSDELKAAGYEINKNLL